MKDRKPILSVTKKDLEVQSFCAGGKGGQRQNKKKTGVRIIHKDSGARGEARDSRSWEQNKKLAFKRLIKSNLFQHWLKIETNRKLGMLDEIDPEEIEREVERQLKHVRIEGKDEKGRWVKLDN